jgi:phosphoglycolate phosphatase
MSTEALIILDLDGTLVDSKADLCKSVNHVRTEFGLSPMTEAVIAGLIGDGAAVLVRRALETKATEADIDRGLTMFLDYYREHMLDESDLYPGVRETLKALDGAKLAVLTNKPYRFSCRMLNGLGIYGHFEVVYGGNSFEQKKPDPVGIFQILSDTGGSRESTWMVGDSSVDVKTGRNAGVRTCGVTYGYAPESFRADPPDHVIDTFSELSDLVRGDF